MGDEVLTMEERHLYSNVVESLIEKASVLTEALDSRNPKKKTFLETFETIIDDLYSMIMGLPAVSAPTALQIDVPSLDIVGSPNSSSTLMVETLKQEESLSTTLFGSFTPGAEKILDDYNAMTSPFDDDDCGSLRERALKLNYNRALNDGTMANQSIEQRRLEPQLTL